MDYFLDGVKYAGRVEMNFVKRIRNTAKRMCGTREKEPFTNDDSDTLFHLVELLKKPFINDHPNDRNVYALNMTTFTGLTIEEQADKIPNYMNIVDGDRSKVNGKVITSSYDELGTTKSPYISSAQEFGITKSYDTPYDKNLTTWYDYKGYLSDYVKFINSISCKTHNDNDVSTLQLNALPLKPKPVLPKPVLISGPSRAPVTPRRRPAQAPAQAPASSGGRRTKRAKRSKHTRHTKRAKRSKRSKHTRRRKH
jgi:hypothetical protein